MTRFLTIILFCFLTAFSCQKKPIITDSNIDLKLSINSVLTDSMQTQLITVTKSTNVQDSLNFKSVEGAKIQIIQNGNVYTFSKTDSNNYASDSPFALINDLKYSIVYEIDTILLEETYTTPLPVIMKKLTAEKNEDFIKIFAEIESPTQQFLQYNIFEQSISIDSNDIADTNWVEKSGDMPFRLANVEVGTNSILLADDFSSFSFDNEANVVKIELTPITKKVNDYFIVLNNYYSTIATYNLYVSAPHFYSNQFYGITYAASWTSIVDSL